MRSSLDRYPQSWNPISGIRSVQSVNLIFDDHFPQVTNKYQMDIAFVTIIYDDNPHVEIELQAVIIKLFMLL